MDFEIKPTTILGIAILLVGIFLATQFYALIERQEEIEAIAKSVRSETGKMTLVARNVTVTAKWESTATIETELTAEAESILGQQATNTAQIEATNVAAAQATADARNTATSEYQTTATIEAQRTAIAKEAVTIGLQEDIPPPKYQGDLTLFILAGQSNMSGAGIVPPIVEDNLNVFTFGNDYHWHVAKEPIDNPFGQIDAVSLDTNAGFGPSLEFATSLWQTDESMKIGLIPCAEWTSSINEWQRNLSEKSLYGSCLRRTLTASPMGDIAGLLFWQGETDSIVFSQTNKIVLPNEWAEYFSTFITDFRSDLDIPNLPVVFVQIGTNTDPEFFENWQIVQAQQESVQLSCVTMINVADLELQDTVNYSTESQHIIGQRLADAFLSLPESCQ